MRAGARTHPDRSVEDPNHSDAVGDHGGHVVEVVQRPASSCPSPQASGHPRCACSRRVPIWT
eukprot:2938168-Rhodomonas_salina.1